MSTIDANNIAHTESELALFQYLSTDTLAQGLGLSGSTVLEPGPMHSGDPQNHEISLAFNATKSLADSINKLISSPDCKPPKRLTPFADRRSGKALVAAQRGEESDRDKQDGEPGASRMLLTGPMQTL